MVPGPCLPPPGLICSFTPLTIFCSPQPRATTPFPPPALPHPSFGGVLLWGSIFEAVWEHPGYPWVPATTRFFLQQDTTHSIHGRTGVMGARVLTP